MSRAGRGIATVIGGNAGAQALAFVSSLAVARLVRPHDYGTFATVAAVAVVLGTVASLRLELAVPIPAREDEADAVLRTVYTAVLAVCGLEAVLLAAAAGPVAAAVGISPSDVSALWFLPPMTLLTGLYAGLTQRALRMRDYSRVASRAVAQAGVTAAAQVALCVVAPASSSLLAGVVIGQVVAVLLLARGDAPVRPASGRMARQVLTRYRSFPLFLTPSALVNAVGLQAPLLLGSIAFGAAFAGWFGMAQRLVAVPVAVLGAAVGQVFLGEFSTLRRTMPEAALRSFDRASRALGAGAFALGLAMAALGPWIVPAVLGSSYAPAGQYVRALSLGVAAQIVASPLSSTLILAGRQARQAAWDVARLLVTAVVFWAGPRSGMEATTTLWLYAGTSCLLYAWLWAESRAAVRATSAEPVNATLPPVPALPGRTS